MALFTNRGALPNFLGGCSLDPFPFASAIKCHQKSTYMQLGWVVRWVLSENPGFGGWGTSQYHL
jgi:hypothetical protein